MGHKVHKELMGHLVRLDLLGDQEKMQRYLS
ncbi:unnamed protein product, partial [Gongylonema pulchrum]